MNLKLEICIRMDRIVIISTGDAEIYLIKNFLPAHLEKDVMEGLQSSKYENFYIGENRLCRTGSFEGDQIEKVSLKINPWLRCPSIDTCTIYPWSQTAGMIKEEVNGFLGVDMNIAKIQRYASGSAFMANHSDKLLDLDKDTPIAVARFGATRTCILINKETKERIEVEVPHNSLLVISYKANLLYTHGIKKQKDLQKESISIVFRQSVTFKSGEHIYGQNTPFKTFQDLLEYQTHPEPDKFWTRDEYEKKLIECYSLDNHSTQGWSDLHKDIAQYSIFA